MSIRTLLVASVCVLVSLGARAQMRGGGGDVWMKYQDELGFAANYSVTMETETGGHKFSARIARLAPKTRSEMELPGMGRMVAIHDPEEANDKGGKGVSYTLFPATKTYMKMAASTVPAAAQKKPETDVQIEELGKETVDGMACVKRRVTVTDPDTRQKHGGMLVWTAAAVHNMPVRIEITERNVISIIRFKEYDFSKPAADLFTVPKDYTPGSMFPGMGMPGGAGVDPSAVPQARDAASRARAAAAAEAAATEKSEAP